MTVLIYANGSSKVGGSHTKRMTALHQALNHRNIHSLFFTNFNKFKKHILNSKEKYLVIVDVPESYKEDLSFLLSENISTIGYEYSGNLLFDYNIVPFKFKLRNFEAKNCVFFGLKFLIIRDEIVSAKDTIPSGYPHAIIALGAGKSKRLAKKLRDTLVKNNNTNQILIVIGKFSRELPIPRSYILKNPSNFPSLLRNAQIVFTTGGATLIESIYMGKRIVCWPQNESEREFARYLAQVYNFRIISTYKEVPNFSDIESVSLKIAKSREIVDGNGLNEIFDLISDIIDKEN